jgi:DNA processing protein
MVDAAWVALSLVDRVGGKTLRALLSHFNHNPAAVLAASAEELQTVPGIGPKIAESIRAINLAEVEQAIPAWERGGVRIITLQAREYPARLRALDDAPPTLFVRGNWRPHLEKGVAVVGTRSPSPEARRIAEELGAELVSRGYAVVSGLAVGIDAAAHLGALAVPDAYPVAVLGSGVLNVYPPSNAQLAAALLHYGAMVSELHPFAGVGASGLVARNRITSGLSDAVIIVETAVDGGAMHAARFARAQGRTVYAVDNQAGGNRALIEGGAIPLRPDLRDLPF